MTLEVFVEEKTTYQNLYEQYKKLRTLDVVAVRKGDEYFLWKDEKSVLDFLKYWKGRFQYYDSSYKQPTVTAKSSGFEQMYRLSSLETPPLLYAVLFDSPRKHDVYGEYIGYGLEHTNFIRSTNTDFGINITKKRLDP